MLSQKTSHIALRVVAATAAIMAFASMSYAEPAAPKTTRVYVIDCGTLGSEKKPMDLRVFYGQDKFKTPIVRMSDPCFLVRNPKGDFLWDTGIPDKQIAGVSESARPDTLVDELKKIDMKPSDIEYLALSHGHWDHVGEMNLFTGATWLSDPKEHESMFTDEARGKELFQYYKDMEKAKTVDVGDNYDVFGDGSVLIIKTPGHSPGHQSLLVHVKNSAPLILSGDLFHSAEARDQSIMPNKNFDKAATASSIEKFNNLAKAENARVIIQHEANDYKKLLLIPKYID